MFHREHTAVDEKTGKRYVIRSDPPLIDAGRQQVRNTTEQWRTEAASDMPLPKSYYCSPTFRALETLEITLNSLKDVVMLAKTPLIVEDLRECINQLAERDWALVQRHDWADAVPKDAEVLIRASKRRSKTEIEERFSGFRFEEGFAEDDKLWREDFKETPEHVIERFQSLLGRVFEEDQAQGKSSIALGMR